MSVNNMTGRIVEIDKQLKDLNNTIDELTNLRCSLVDEKYQIRAKLEEMVAVERKQQAEEAERKRQAEIAAEIERKLQAEFEAERKRQAEFEAERKRQAEFEAERKRQAEEVKNTVKVPKVTTFRTGTYDRLGDAIRSLNNVPEHIKQQHLRWIENTDDNDNAAKEYTHEGARYILHNFRKNYFIKHECSVNVTIIA